MIHDALFALWFLLPAALANMAPVFAAALPGLRNLQAPLDGGRSFRGKPLLGPHKTWRGIVSGMVVGGLVFLGQQLAFHHLGWGRSWAGTVRYGDLPLVLGPLLGFGALAGDAIKSFAKRQIGKNSGQAWPPFDQLDYIVGAILVSLPFVILPWVEYAWMLVAYFVFHIIVSYFGYLLGLKEAAI